MIRRLPGSTRTTHSFPTRRSPDLAAALTPAGKKLAFGRRQAQQPALAVAESETDRRMRHGEARERVLHVARLGAGGFQELEARRRRTEQVAHFDAGDRTSVA